MRWSRRRVQYDPHGLADSAAPVAKRRRLGGQSPRATPATRSHGRRIMVPPWCDGSGDGTGGVDTGKGSDQWTTSMRLDPARGQAAPDEAGEIIDELSRRMVRRTSPIRWPRGRTPRCRKPMARLDRNRRRTSGAPSRSRRPGGCPLEGEGQVASELACLGRPQDPPVQLRFVLDQPDEDVVNWRASRTSGSPSGQQALTASCHRLGELGDHRTVRPRRSFSGRRGREKNLLTPLRSAMSVIVAAGPGPGWRPLPH